VRLERFGLLVLLSFGLSAFTRVAHQRSQLVLSDKEVPPRRAFRTSMPSALRHSRRTYPAAHLPPALVHQRSVHPGPLVRRPAPLKLPAPRTDRHRPVSGRAEPSSRAPLMGEQPNPWDLLQPQDVTSRHRGAKPPRRYELLGEISL